jgi:hypothetical protein
MVKEIINLDKNKIVKLSKPYGIGKLWTSTFNDTINFWINTLFCRHKTNTAFVFNVPCSEKRAKRLFTQSTVLAIQGHALWRQLQ